MIYDRGLSESPSLTPFYIERQRNFHEKSCRFSGNYLKKKRLGREGKGKIIFCPLRGRWLGTFKYHNRPPKRSHATDAPTPLSNLLTNTKVRIRPWTLSFLANLSSTFGQSGQQGFFSMTNWNGGRSRRKLIPARNFDELILLFLFRSDALGSFSSSGQKFATHPVRGW